VILSALALLALAFLPGAAVALAATPAHSRVRRVSLAASPAVSYGLVGGAVSWSTLWDRRLPALGVLGIELLVVALACALRVLATKTARGPGWHISAFGVMNRVKAHRTDVLGLSVALAGSVLVGWLMLRRSGGPPGWDSMNHALLAGRVMQSGSALPRDVCLTGSTSPTQACEFYPLAPHVMWVQGSQLTGTQLSSVMLALCIVVLPITAGIGSFALARVCGAGTLVASLGAFTLAVIGPIWPCLATGRLTVPLGAALAPSVALMVWLALRTPRARSMHIVAGVGLGGLALAHSYDVVAAALLWLGLVVTRPTRGKWRFWLLRSAAILGVALALVAPQFRSLVGAGVERRDAPPHLQGHWLDALGHWLYGPSQYLATVVVPPLPGAELVLPPLLPGPGTAVSLAVSLAMTLGIVVAFLPRFRWARPFAVAHLLTLVIIVIIVAGGGPVRDAVASLFYGDGRRPLWSSIAAPSVLALAGVISALTAVARVVGRGRTQLQNRGVLAWTAAILLVLPVVVLPDTAASPWRFAARALPQDAAYDRVGVWLRAHPGVVADDQHREFLTWLYADHRIPLLFGLVPLRGTTDPDWARRMGVWNTLVGTRPGRGTCLLDPYDVRWVAIGTHAMPGGRQRYLPDRLRESPYLRLAHQDGPITVYAVDHLCGTGR
jgi:hypothetical protein